MLRDLEDDDELPPEGDNEPSSRETEGSFWDRFPPGPVDLWTMLQLFLHEIAKLFDTFALVRLTARDLAAQARAGEQGVDFQERYTLLIRLTRYALKKAKKQFDVLDFEASQEQIDSMHSILEHDSSPETLCREFSMLQRIALGELKRHLFFYVPKNKADRFKAPLGKFKRAAKAFPSAKGDMEEASKAFACSRYGACVYHCMGVLQAGLFALADTLKIPSHATMPLETWGKIIGEIESEIKKLQNTPKTMQRDDLVKFYSSAALHFNFVKDAWRNHVMHARSRYDEHLAEGILTHTIAFMEHISTRLSEAP